MDVEAGGLVLAGLIPGLFYAATTSLHGYWLDSGGLEAASVSLGVAHPPGHPLALLLGALMGWLPLGPLPFRIALGQGLCAAGASALVFRAAATTMKQLGVADPWARASLALGAALLVAGSGAWWIQAVRPEVYALQALLVLFTIERLVTLEAVAGQGCDPRPLYAASFALGLGLANHHLVAILAIPPALPTVTRVFAARGARAVVLSALAVGLGLTTYLYLPLRAIHDPLVNLGDPDSLERFFWVVSARVYAHDMGLSAPLPLHVRGLDVIVLLVDHLHGVVVVAAPIGGYALLRSPHSRRLGVLWLLTALVNLGARAWLGSVRGNPDILGYMMPGFAAVAVLGVAAVGALSARLCAATGRRFWAAPLSGLVLLFGVSQLWAGSGRASLASFRATDSFDDARIRRLPPNAVVFYHDPQSVFRHLSLRASERSRPDVVMVPVPFLGYPGVLARLSREHPALRETLRGLVLEGKLGQADLQSLAAERPVWVELDVRVPPALFETLLPRGLLYEVIAAGATRTDVAEASRDHRLAMARLNDELAAAPQDSETQRQQVWDAFMDALYFAAVGQVDEARYWVAAALALSPEAEELKALARALAQADGPIDIEPFLPGPPRER